MSHTIDITEPLRPIARKFVSMGGDIDYQIYERYFSGRITKERYKALDSYCRRNTWHSHCGHEHDCCGCLCSQSMSFSYKHNQVIISLTQSYNY